MVGLSFDNYQRNSYLAAHGAGMPTATSTGTTIVGCKFNGGVVVSKDTSYRSSAMISILRPRVLI